MTPLPPVGSGDPERERVEALRNAFVTGRLSVTVPTTCSSGFLERERRISEAKAKEYYPLRRKVRREVNDEQGYRYRLVGGWLEIRYPGETHWGRTFTVSAVAALRDLLTGPEFEEVDLSL